MYHGRTGQQDGTARKGKQGQDTQKKTARTGQPRPDCRDMVARTAKTRQPRQDSQGRTASTGQDRNGKIIIPLEGFYEKSIFKNDAETVFLKSFFSRMDLEKKKNQRLILIKIREGLVLFCIPVDLDGQSLYQDT
jgi:hypothetical protein